MRLEADGLAFGYPGRILGRDIGLRLAGGEVVALLGPNGSGKTTLLKTLLGLLPVRGGSIRLDGTPLERLSEAERARRIGYVPQASASPFAFSAMDVVLMGRTAHAGLFAGPSRRDVAVALAALDRLGIGHLAERPSTQLSGGERQLVLVARALAQEPAFLVLDEPTASLDFGNQGKVMARLAALATEGLGVLFTTHDPNQALRIAVRALLIRDGALLAEGAPGDVLTPARLTELYRTEVDLVQDAAGRRALIAG